MAAGVTGKDSADGEQREHSVTSRPAQPLLNHLDRLPALVWIRDRLSTRRPLILPSVWFLLAIILVNAVVGFAAGWLGASRATSDVVFNASLGKQKQIVTSQGQLINQIAKMVGPSVVSVNVTSTSQNVDSFFGYGLSQSEQSAGTGIILTSSGLIVTNRHVVPAGTTNVSVTLADGTEFKNVSVVGRTNASSSLDIAFLKIRNLGSYKLTPAILGDSTRVQVGDSVVTIGNALGQFQNTVTAGIISGYGRSVQASSQGTGQNSENLDNLFQTDAAINEGNSGGPLVNLNGQVIGINTAIAGGAQNIGFSIPINDVKGLITQVEQTGKLQLPWLGVYYIPLTNDVVQQYGLNVTKGAWIPSATIIGQNPIVSGGPADKAGVKQGDVIVKIDDQTISQNHSLTSIISGDRVGQQVTLTIVRNGQTITLSATLAAAPSDSAPTVTTQSYQYPF